MVINKIVKSSKIWAVVGLLAMLATACSENNGGTSDEEWKKWIAKKGNWKVAYTQAGKLAEFNDLPHYEEMQRILSYTRDQAKQEDGKSLAYGMFETRLAKAYFFTRRYQDALAPCHEALRIYKEHKPPTAWMYATVYFTGIANWNLGRYDEALPFLLQAIKLSKDPAADPQKTIEMLYDKTEDCYIHKGDTAKAQAIHKEKLARLSGK